MILSAQSIRALSLTKRADGQYEYWTRDRFYRTDAPLIAPFSERGVVRGRSYGLSACTYDCRIAHPLVIPVGQFRLAVTMERFNFPAWLCGSVLDKSSWARVGVSAFNTHFDPGFRGYATLELVNLGPEPVEYTEGDPVCQFMFHLLDAPTEMPYGENAKYQNQEQKPVEARYERD